MLWSVSEGTGCASFMLVLLCKVIASRNESVGLKQGAFLHCKLITIGHCYCCYHYSHYHQYHHYHYHYQYYHYYYNNIIIIIIFVITVVIEVITVIIITILILNIQMH